MLPKGLNVLIFMTSLYYYKSLSKAQFTEGNLSKFSTEDYEQNSSEFYQQELNSNNLIYNKSRSNSIDLSDKHSDDVIVKIISKLREKPEDNELYPSFEQSLIAFFYENHPEQTCKTDYFGFINLILNYWKEFDSIPLNGTEKVIDVQYFNLYISLFRNVPKYISKDEIIINQTRIEEYLPLIKEYSLIKNDKYLDDFPSNILEVIKNMKYENIPDYFKIENEKLVKMSALMPDPKREERSLSNHSTLVDIIFSSIKGGGSNLMDWNMANEAFEGETEHNS